MYSHFFRAALFRLRRSAPVLAAAGTLALGTSLCRADPGPTSASSPASNVFSFRSALERVANGPLDDTAAFNLALSQMNAVLSDASTANAAAAQASPELIDALAAHALSAGGPGSSLSGATHAAMLQVLAGLAQTETSGAGRRPKVLAAAVTTLHAYTPALAAGAAGSSAGRSWWGGSKGSTAAGTQPVKSAPRDIALIAVSQALIILLSAEGGRGVGLASFGQQLLTSLAQLAELPLADADAASASFSSSSGASVSTAAAAAGSSTTAPSGSGSSAVSTAGLAAAVRSDAMALLSTCCQREGFPEADIVSAGVVRVLCHAIDAKRSKTALQSREGRHACAALRELAWQHPDTSPVVAALAAEGAVPLLLALAEAADAGVNVWTRRAACKALAYMADKPGLLAASPPYGSPSGGSKEPVTAARLMVALEAAGKADFMCAKAARHAERAIARANR